MIKFSLLTLIASLCLSCLPSAVLADEDRVPTRNGGHVTFVLPAQHCSKSVLDLLPF